MLELHSFDHITIIVSDLSQTRQFYVGLLGMVEVDRPAFDFPGIWLQLGGIQIHATLASEEAGIAGLGDLRSTHPSRGHHFAFEVASMDGVLQELRDRKIRLVAGPKNRPDGPTQVCIKDPDDHVIELFCRRP